MAVIISVSFVSWSVQHKWCPVLLNLLQLILTFSRKPSHRQTFFWRHPRKWSGCQNVGNWILFWFQDDFLWPTWVLESYCLKCDFLIFFFPWNFGFWSLTFRKSSWSQKITRESEKDSISDILTPWPLFGVLSKKCFTMTRFPTESQN